jgi:putative flavoprotein involved in K+ transport
MSRFDAPPGMEFPGAADSYPEDDHIADFLQAYAAKFELPVKLNLRRTI